MGGGRLVGGVAGVGGVVAAVEDDEEQGERVGYGGHALGVGGGAGQREGSGGEGDPLPRDGLAGVEVGQWLPRQHERITESEVGLLALLSELGDAKWLERPQADSRGKTAAQLRQSGDTSS